MTKNGTTTEPRQTRFQVGDLVELSYSNFVSRREWIDRLAYVTAVEDGWPWGRPVYTVRSRYGYSYRVDGSSIVERVDGFVLRDYPNPALGEV